MFRCLGWRILVSVSCPQKDNLAWLYVRLLEISQNDILWTAGRDRWFEQELPWLDGLGRTATSQHKCLKQFDAFSLQYSCKYAEATVKAGNRQLRSFRVRFVEGVRSPASGSLSDMRVWPVSKALIPTTPG